MLTIGYYLLKVMICSGVLYGYYFLALRNKAFHRWNRFYLMTAVILSITVPLIKIHLWQAAGGTSPQVFQILQVVNSGDEFVDNYTKGQNSFELDYSMLFPCLYAAIAGLMLLIILSTLIKIQKLKNRYPPIFIQGVNFRNTQEEGTPFSFFRNIFWNEKLDINSSAGSQIFQHEIAHVKEKHSHDKMFINLLLILFWYNPIFWLIRKELNMIHEFIADNMALEDGDTASFAAMILQATYPQHQFMLTNNFFYSPLKRRLTMLTKNKNPRLGYIGRLLVLPVAAVIFLAFTLKMKTRLTDIIHSDKKFTVIIDAAHGGDDNGMSFNGINEKDITLSIAKKIKALSTNDNIEIVLTRQNDESVKLEDRINMVAIKRADIFISIHTDGAVHPKSGLSVWISKHNDNPYFTKSSILGTSLIEAFRSDYQLPVSKSLYQRDIGIRVLDQNQSPAILIQAGYINNSKDLDFLLKDENQTLLALDILKAIEKYAQITSSKITGGSFSDKNDVPESIKKSADPAISNMQMNKSVDKDSIPQSPAKKDKNILFIKDGVDIGYDQNILSTINPENISAINVLTGESAVKKYGSRAKDGVIEITTKHIIIKDSSIVNEKIPKLAIKDDQESDNMVFTRVENPAEFEGGELKWKRYLENILQKNSEVLNSEESRGVCTLKFIVNRDGKSRDVEVLTMQNTKLADILKSAILDAKWKPGMQNGIIVASYKTISVTNK